MVRFILLLLSLSLLAEVATAQSIPPSTKSGAERPKPVVNIQEQAGTPFKITSAETKWVTPDGPMLELYVVVENVSELEIRAYAWRIGTTDGRENNDGCFFYNIESPDWILRPGGPDGKSTWRRIPLNGSSSNIDLSVDFAEFTNGSTWGIDTCKSAERLGGLRAGALAAKNKFANIQDQNRSKELIDLLKLENPIIEAPDGHTPVWLEGFRHGVRTIFERLRTANQKGGLQEVERVLQLPFDASGQ